MLQCKLAAAAKTGVRTGSEGHWELLQDMPCMECPDISINELLQESVIALKLTWSIIQAFYQTDLICFCRCF